MLRQLLTGVLLAGILTIAITVFTIASDSQVATPASTEVTTDPDYISPSLWDLATQMRGSRDRGLAVGSVRDILVQPSISFTCPAVGDEFVEGSMVTLTWNWTGPVTEVRLYYYGPNTKLGGRSRGNFGELVCGRILNEGTFEWKVPYIDAGWMRLRIAGFNIHGQQIAEFERTVQFRPAEFAGLSGTYIAISKKHQRLFYYEDDQLKRVHIVSTARPGYRTPEMQPGSYDPRRGRMGQVFYKSWAPRSRQYDCVMPYWMAITSTGSHGIHATSRPFYWRLGRPASHGCVRQHRADAAILFKMVDIGTPVYVF